MTTLNRRAFSPNGGLIVCEDGNNEQYVRGLTRDGKIFDFAKNILPGYEGKEFAGATFSPDGHTLFVNIQTPGMTLAIWGPWERGRCKREPYGDVTNKFITT